MIRTISSNRLTNFLMFRIEKFLIKGPFYQMAFITALIGLLSLVGGLILRQIDAQSPSLAETSWWAFLRMSDPGYLGDDQGSGKRLLSTFLTISGYVLFVGAFVAILTQWLTRTIKRLEAGFTPISMSDHIIILGFTNRTATIVREILWVHATKRLSPKSIDRKKPKIVVLNQEVGWDIEHQMQQALRGVRGLHHITLRSGHKTNLHDLLRLDILRASKVIIPAETFTEEEDEHTDTQTIKTLLTLKNLINDQKPSRAVPHIVAELLDADKGTLCEQIFPSSVNILASRQLISRILAQSIFNPGIIRIYETLLTDMLSDSVTLIDLEELSGIRWYELKEQNSKILPLGLIRTSPGPDELESTTDILLCPGNDTVIAPDDRLIALAREQPKFYQQRVSQDELEQPTPDLLKTERPQAKKILIFGWSMKIKSILDELVKTPNCQIQIDIVSVIERSERKLLQLATELNGKKLQINHLVADYTEKTEFDRLQILQYDNLVFLASDWLDSVEYADARTIVGYLFAYEQLRERAHRPRILIELVDPSNERLFRLHGDEVILSPVIISHILANIALEKQLKQILHHLCDPGSTNVLFLNAASIALEGVTNFKAYQRRVDCEGQTLIGFEDATTRLVHLNPDDGLLLSQEDQLIILQNLEYR